MRLFFALIQGHQISPVVLPSAIVREELWVSYGADLIHQLRSGEQRSHRASRGFTYVSVSSPLTRLRLRFLQPPPLHLLRGFEKSG